LGKEEMTWLSEAFAGAGEDAGTLAEIIGNIDWTSDNAINELNTALAEQGINVEDLGPSWNTLIAAMVEANHTAYDLINRFD
jgi:hypothetical protein